MQLATGKLAECPFDAATINKGRELIFVTLELAGRKLPVRERAEHQLFLAATEELLHETVWGSGLPCLFHCTQSFANGVHLGVGAKLPRVPAVFEGSPPSEARGKDSPDLFAASHFVYAPAWLFD